MIPIEESTCVGSVCKVEGGNPIQISYPVNNKLANCISRMQDNGSSAIAHYNYPDSKVHGTNKNIAD